MICRLNVNHPWSESGYNWLLVSTDDPHGTVVEWLKDSTEKLDWGAKEPVLNARYQQNFTISLKNKGRFDVCLC